MESFMEYGETWGEFDGMNPVIFTINEEIIKDISSKQKNNFKTVNNVSSVGNRIRTTVTKDNKGLKVK